MDEEILVENDGPEDPSAAKQEPVMQKAELLAILAEKNEELEYYRGRIVQLEQSLKQLNLTHRDVLNSLSWRLTAPIRFLLLFLKSPRYAIKLLITYLDERSPAALRKFLLRARLGSTEAVSAHFPGEISWKQFEEKVLSRRDEFKGVFIQEATIPWVVDLHQRPQHMCCAMGELGYLVIYRTLLDNVRGACEVEKNVWITARDEVEAIEGAVHSFYSTAKKYSPAHVSDIRSRSAAVIYEYIDHIDPKISGDDPEGLDRLQSLRDFAFRGGFDYVACSARVLYEEMAQGISGDKLLMIPNGVDTRHYRGEPDESIVLPDDYLEFRARYQHVVGYFGAIAPWIWFDMLEGLSAGRPDLGFVFIGPDYLGVLPKLPQRDNVLHLGPVVYQNLPAYARLFDVAIIPFEPGEIARTTSPLKLFEYFALEKPVVCTAEMLECVQYEEVLSGTDPVSFGSAIDQALALAEDSSFTARLAKLADENDWRVRVQPLESVFQRSGEA